ncbi:MAG TPA: bifunctional adenosylcobinamide kinase/adenosylcobinamide-phosphate guanylyltransferase [Spirochaetia bacterium]|nr:bifunctional adenosylcobinamide kinase/adenosylcobinamide-phosphate guanylyltransferase [Spirochaetia bacterium]
MLILITGGSRSGKSGFALQQASTMPHPRVFLATAQAADDEMRGRIEAHKRSRPPEWGLVEEPLEVTRALTRTLERAGTVIVDCVTLWVSNLILADETLGEKEVADRAEELAVIASESPAPVIVVTNEVGSGVVPDNALARRFRDCAGRANQVLARWAAEVHLMVSGIPMTIRKGKEQG